VKVRNYRGFVIGVAMAAAAVQSAIAEGQRPSQSTLSAMGLGGMAVMSDEDAMSVRGRGYMGGGGSSASAFGNSFATFSSPFGTAHSENGYQADGKKFAAGKNYSEAGVALTIDRGRGGKPDQHACERASH